MLINICHNCDIAICTLLILFFVVHSHQSTSPKSGDKPEPKKYGSCTRPFFPIPDTKEKRVWLCETRAAPLTFQFLQVLLER